MDELGGLLGGLMGIAIAIYVLAWLIAIIVTIVVAATLIAGPPIGLGVLLKRLLTQKYELSSRKKSQCAGIVVASFMAPFLVLLADSSQTAVLAAAWAGVVIGMSNFALFLAISAYRQHYAMTRRNIFQARRSVRNGRFRQSVARLKLWHVESRVNRIERRHGDLLRAHEGLTAQMSAAMEKGDPALLQIKLNHWEREYSALPTKALTAKQALIARELPSSTDSIPIAAQLHGQFVDAMVIQRRLEANGGISRYKALVDDRDDLRSAIARDDQKIESCQRSLAQNEAKIRDLKSRKLVIQ